MTAPEAACPPCDEVLQACNVAALRALELAGRRMVPRHLKAAAPSEDEVPVWARHTVLPVEVGDLDRLLAGAWDLLAVALPGRTDLITALDAYVREVLYQGLAHTLDALRAHLARTGLAESG